MDKLDTVMDWVPSAPAAVADRASDLLDFDLDVADLVGDVVDVAGDLVEVAGEGLVTAVAATEAASRATLGIVRRHPLIAALVAGAVVAAVLMLVGKRRNGADEGSSTGSLHVAA